MALTAREKLQDRYEIVRSIKSGGMGAVYEAVDHKLASTPCAIKEVLSSALEGSGAAYVLRSFESEMKALAALEHPNIPRVRDYFQMEGRRCSLTKRWFRLEGISLKVRLLPALPAPCSGPAARHPLYAGRQLPVSESLATRVFEADLLS